jgi:hypothetical protein
VCQPSKAHSSDREYPTRRGSEKSVLGALRRDDNVKILKIRTLDSGWCDKDYIMLHAVFQLLVDSVEQEKPDQIVDWNYDPEHKRAWKEIQLLYRWWEKARPARKSPLDGRGLKKPPISWKKLPGDDLYQLVDYDKKKYAGYVVALKKHKRMEKKWNNEDQRNLHRLMEIRPFLWT